MPALSVPGCARGRLIASTSLDGVDAGWMGICASSRYSLGCSSCCAGRLMQPASSNVAPSAPNRPRIALTIGRGENSFISNYRPGLFAGAAFRLLPAIEQHAGILLQLVADAVQRGSQLAQLQHKLVKFRQRLPCELLRA